MSERLPTLLDEVGKLPPELMPDDFRGVNFYTRLSDEVRDGTMTKEQLYLRVVGELARRAFTHTAIESCYVCKQKEAEFEKYLRGEVIETEEEQCSRAWHLIGSRGLTAYEQYTRDFPLNDPRD